MRSPSGIAWIFVLAGVSIGAVLLLPRETHPPAWPDGPMPDIMIAKDGSTVRISAIAGSALLVSNSPTGPLRKIDGTEIELDLDRASWLQAGMLATPTAVQWNHPLPGLPMAMVVRAAECDRSGRMGPIRMVAHWSVDHGALSVVSLAIPEGALFDADTGIYVVGNAMLHPPSKQIGIYREDGRWWKYPGNYSMRGKEWEREGQIQVIGPSGDEIFQGSVGVRIHGNMTRGFPLKALRLTFEEPVKEDLFPGSGNKGGRSVVLRPGGNDGTKALMRDAVANALCADLPFEVSRARPAVLYINGAYWGIHHLRQRLDEKELAARCGSKSKDIALLEVELRSIFGDPEAVDRFRSLVKRSNTMDPEDPGFLDAVSLEIDLDSFLPYMASCMILGQRDWPLRNVRVWRHAGEPGPGLKDGRWRFVMNDMDLCMGAQANADGAFFHQLEHKGYALADLWRGLMRNQALRDHFAAEVEQLLSTVLSAERMVQTIDGFAGILGPEMQRHILRWRKPSDIRSWEREVEGMRTFAKGRPAAVRQQMAEMGWTR